MITSSAHHLSIFRKAGLAATFSIGLTCGVTGFASAQSLLAQPSSSTYAGRIYDFQNPSNSAGSDSSGCKSPMSGAILGGYVDSATSSSLRGLCRY
jgi:hypothetical protein